MTGRRHIHTQSMAAAVILCLLLLWQPRLGAQTLRKPVNEYDFAQFGLNCIRFQGDSSSFERLYCKMDSVLFKGQGNLRIVHIGGSHVQAGTFTGQIRRNLLSLRPMLDGGRGLVFPFSAARTNNPSSFTTSGTGEWKVTKNVQKSPDRRLGLAGIALSTSDAKASVTVTAVARDPKPSDPVFTFNDVTVLGYSSGDRVPVVVLEKGDTLAGTLVEADSSWFFRLPSLTDSVKVSTRGQSGEFTLTGILLDNPFPGITVTEIGVNGASLNSYAKCSGLERDLERLNPDLVLLGIGINDAAAPDFSADDFVMRYKRLVAQIHSAAPGCAVLFITNNDSFRRIRRKGYVVNSNGQLAEQAFLRLGKDCGAGVWDLFEIMGGLGSMKRWEEAGLAKRDKVHFTEAGYELLGDLLFNALMDRYVEHLTR